MKTTTRRRARVPPTGIPILHNAQAALAVVEEVVLAEGHLVYCEKAHADACALRDRAESALSKGVTLTTYQKAARAAEKTASALEKAKARLTTARYRADRV